MPHDALGRKKSDFMITRTSDDKTAIYLVWGHRLARGCGISHSKRRHPRLQFARDTTMGWQVGGVVRIEQIQFRSSRLRLPYAHHFLRLIFDLQQMISSSETLCYLAADGPGQEICQLACPARVLHVVPWAGTI